MLICINFGRNECRKDLILAKTSDEMARFQLKWMPKWVAITSSASISFASCGPVCVCVWEREREREREIRTIHMHLLVNVANCDKKSKGESCRLDRFLNRCIGTRDKNLKSQKDRKNLNLWKIVKIQVMILWFYHLITSSSFFFFFLKENNLIL